MGIDVTEMQRLAGVVPTDDGYHSYREAAGGETLDEDMASGARGWLSGVKKALATWTDKLAKGGASTSQVAALKVLDQAVSNAMSKLGEDVEALDAEDALFEEDVPAYEKGGDLDAFNTALAKLCGKLKKDLGAEAVRQNYKGTGSQKFRRQLFVRFKDTPGADLWLDAGYAKIGGVVFMPFADKTPIPYAGKTPADVYAELLKRMQFAQDKIKQTQADKAASGSGGAPVPAEALESVGRDDIFGDHGNWARALLGESTVVEAKKSDADKARSLMVMGLWKKFSNQLHGTGYARIEGKKHVVRMKPGGDVGGDLVSIMTKGTDVTLEDLSDAELKEMFLKALKWLGQFERAWVQKHIDAIQALLPAE